MQVCSQCAANTEESGRYCPDCGGDLVPDPAASLVGAVIDGQFEVQQLLGGGAFGKVYKARQIGLDRPCAIKVPTHEIAADPIMGKRFAREARAAARVIHPGVVQIYAVGELPEPDQRPYLAMQLVDGKPLDQSIVKGPLHPVRALRIARAIASALSDTHAAGVVHRDLKPTNIIWRRDRNGDDRITLVDFGIAACKPNPGAGVDATKLTHGGLIGTPHYMSPEQAHGDAVDARADLYALGCVLFELVTAKTPFEGSAIEVMLAHLGRPAPLPSEIEASVPEAVDRICGALLAKRPEGRPASADEVVTMIDVAVRDLESGRSLPERSSIAKALAKRKTLATRRDLPYDADIRRRVPRWLVAVGGAAILIAGTGFGALVLGRDRGAAASMSMAAHHDRDEPTDQPNAPVHSGAGVQDIVRDDGGIFLHALVPEPISAGTEVRPHLEIKNKLGQPVVADSVVVTITDDRGTAKGLTAHPHGDDKSGHYDFHYTFPAAGHYVLRVFPPSIDSAFEIDLDVK